MARNRFAGLGPYARLYSRAARDHKIIGLSAEAVCFWVFGLMHIADKRSDGFIPEAIARTLFPAKDVDRVIAELCGELPQVLPQGVPYGSTPGNTPGRPNSVWIRVPGGFVQHDYTDWNPSAAEIAELENQRKALSKRANSVRHSSPSLPQVLPHGSTHGSTHGLPHGLPNLLSSISNSSPSLRSGERERAREGDGPEGSSFGESSGPLPDSDPSPEPAPSTRGEIPKRSRGTAPRNAPPASPLPDSPPASENASDANVGAKSGMRIRRSQATPQGLELGYSSVSPIPEDWTPTERDIAGYEMRGVPSDLARDPDELEKFRAHYLGSGDVKANWSQVFGKWLVQAKTYRKRDTERERTRETLTNVGTKRPTISRHQELTFEHWTPPRPLHEVIAEEEAAEAARKGDGTNG